MLIQLLPSSLCHIRHTTCSDPLIYERIRHVRLFNQLSTAVTTLCYLLMSRAHRGFRIRTGIADLTQPQWQRLAKAMLQTICRSSCITENETPKVDFRSTKLGLETACEHNVHNARQYDTVRNPGMFRVRDTTAVMPCWHRRAHAME